MAWPVAATRPALSPLSTPAAARPPTVHSPSAPTAPTWRTAAPAIAAAIDWLAP
jgi:hypothetical protein